MRARPLRRFAGSRGRRTGGSGLGLTIAQAGARSHDGAITVENRPEGGLRVTFSIPKLACAAEGSAYRPRVTCLG
ncbi:ATP-binding protein [Bosea sp. RAF48]|uniref:ATP-binding protein n=1 Tax=Bosea sp. RAF48 TaxID=3237480 RepID=UPI003F92AF5C